MHLGKERLRAWPDGARGAPASTVADPAGTDAEMVFVVRHEATIGRSNGRHKVENDSIGLWRRNTCHGAEAAEGRTPHIAGATQNSIENIAEIDFSGTAAPRASVCQPPKNNVQTNT
jgi:hypothetical protein